MKLGASIKDDVERKKFLSSIRANIFLIEQIIEVCAKDREASERITRSSDRFANPAWAEETAFELGKQAYATSMIQMLNQALKEKKDE